MYNLVTLYIIRFIIYIIKFESLHCVERKQGGIEDSSRGGGRIRRMKKMGARARFSFFLNIKINFSCDFYLLISNVFLMHPGPRPALHAGRDRS